MKFRNPFRRKEKSLTHTMDDGWVDTGWDWGYWQQNRSIKNMGVNATVEACISALSQTTAMCPIYHLVEGADGAITRKNGSNAERVMRDPNPYNTRSLFMNNAIRSMYFTGNAYAVARRDDRGAVGELHLMDPRSTRAVMDAETGNVFYYVTPQHNQPFQSVSEEDRIFPARNVLHLRIHTGHDPLKGETPLSAAAASVSANTAITGHQSKFFNNMSRPSGVLSTTEKLNKEQMVQLREAWERQSKGMDSGGIPILAGGLSWQGMSLSSQDAQMVEAFGMTIADISRAFRVPPPMVNDLTGATFNNSEQLNSWFLASGLGFLLEHIELELNKLFGLPFNERLNFDTRQLLRSDWKTRMEALSEGVLKGVYSPNEARAKEGLPPVAFGDEPRVQQQVVPLSAYDSSEPPPPEPEPTEEERAAIAYDLINKEMSAHG